MKQSITFIIVAIMTCSSMAHAQRLIKGRMGIKFSIGLISDKKPVTDYYLQAGMTVNSRNGNYQFYELGYTLRRYEAEGYSLPIETFTGAAGFIWRLLADRGRNISVNMGIAALAGYEMINRGAQVLPNGALIKSESHLIYGGGLRISLEAYLTDHLLMLVEGKTDAVYGTSLQHLRPSAGIGCRYIF